VRRVRRVRLLRLGVVVLLRLCLRLRRVVGRLLCRLFRRRVVVLLRL
jgi:hypothetical protein